MMRAFTIVELLVVVAIIVLLLALLAPALDKAVYQAVLAQCAAQQRNIAGSTTLYAASNRRFYPSNIKRRADYLMPNHIGSEIEIYREMDLRPILKSFISARSWVDPFCDPVNLSEEASDVTTMAASSFNYWAGFLYTGRRGGSGMLKIGDRLGWRDEGPGVPPHDDTAALMVSDCNDIHADTVYINSAHPDSEGVLRNWKLQNASVAEYFYTWSIWADSDGEGRTPRGQVDLNFAYDDGSVLRHIGVSGDFNRGPLESSDGTIFHGAPWHADSNAANAYRFVAIR